MFQQNSLPPGDPLRKVCVAYANLLRAGIDADDRTLARSPDYSDLLMSGLAIRHRGGAAAVGEARNLIVASIPGAEARHFDRLWNGLLPG
jgi:hypothetical protein